MLVLDGRGVPGFKDDDVGPEFWRHAQIDLLYGFGQRTHWQAVNDLYFDEKAHPVDFVKRLRFSKRDVLRLWPAQHADPERSAYQWLSHMMRENPQKQPKPKEDFKHDAVRRWPKLGSRQYDRAWQLALSENPQAHAWGRSGPKGPRKSQKQGTAKLRTPKR